MWKVIHEKMVLNASPTLNDAMQYAKNLDKFVTITDGVTEFVGKFGVDEVKDPLYNGWISRKKEKMSV